MNRFKFLVPRFVFLLVLCLGIWVSSTFLAKVAINESDVALRAGMRVDDAQVDWSEKSVALRNLTVGNPSGGRPVLEMDKVVLHLDWDSVLGRKLVVRDGVVTNLTMIPANSPKQTRASDGTESESNSLSGRIVAAISQAQPSDLSYHQSSPALATGSWWTHVKTALTAGSSNSSHTTVAAKALQTKWQLRIEDCRKRAASMEAEIVSLKKTSTVSNNPLRSHGPNMQAAQRITELTAQIVDLQAEVQDIQRLAILETKSLSDTAAGEIRLFQTAMRIPTANPQQLTSQLLQQQQLDEINKVILWVDWAGNLVPNFADNPIAVRGRNVNFGKPAEASLDVKKLTLVGVTDVGGQYYRYMGNLSNLSNNPDVQSQPTSLSLRSQGPQHVIVNGLFDRTGGSQKTYLSIKTPDLQHPSGDFAADHSTDSLGIGLKVSPTQAFTQVNVNLEGEKLSGKVVIRHSNVDIEVDSNELGDAALANLINFELETIDSYETTYVLSGSLDHVVATPQCDLGNRIASAMNTATNQHLGQMVVLRSTYIQTLVQNQQQQLNQWVNQQTNDVLALIQSDISRIASLKGVVERLDDSNLRLR